MSSPSATPLHPDPSGPVVGVVLAAGAGTRFGMPKVLAGQGMWLQSAVRALVDGGCDAVLVTLGAALVEVPAPARAVVVDDWAIGLSASVRAGIQAAVGVAARAAVLLVVDTPDTNAAVVRRVVDAAHGRRDVVVRAVFEGHPGHPVYLGADHLAAVVATLSGDRGAGGYIDQRPDAMTVECGDLASGRDRDLN